MSTLAIAQIKSSTDVETNLHTARTLIGEARRKGAQLIALPEFLMAFSPNAQRAADLAKLAQPVDGPFVSDLRRAAKGSGIAVLATIYETCEMPDRVYDTAVWIDAAGSVAAVYRKLHLYDAFGFKESDKFHPGQASAEPVVWNGARCGVMICYDLRFPEMARMLALDGADILFAPSGWVQGDMKLDHWQTVIKARALENGCYLVAPDQTGNIYLGHSSVVDPFGRIVVDLEDRVGLEIIELDLSVVSEAREKLPVLANRRTDVYTKSFGGR
jgi:deaminated glutathione amidase